MAKDHLDLEEIKRRQQQLVEMKKVKQGQIEAPQVDLEAEKIVPHTVKEKQQNFWYHYKWVTIGSILGAALLIFFIADMATKDKYDITIMAFNQYQGYLDTDIQAKTFEQFADDTDENGEVAGKTTFSVSVSDTATETTVIKLDDGSQIAVVPKGTNTLWLDFVVNDDGTITIVPGTPVEEPTNEVPVTKPSDSGNPIINNPVISKTGELIRENPLAAAAVFLCGLSLIFFIILRKKRKDDEEEENTKPVC